MSDSDSNDSITQHWKTRKAAKLEEKNRVAEEVKREIERIWLIDCWEALEKVIGSRIDNARSTQSTRSFIEDQQHLANNLCSEKINATRTLINPTKERLIEHATERSEAEFLRRVGTDWQNNTRDCSYERLAAEVFEISIQEIPDFPPIQDLISRVRRIENNRIRALFLTRVIPRFDPIAQLQQQLEMTAGTEPEQDLQISTEKTSSSTPNPTKNKPDKGKRPLRDLETNEIDPFEDTESELEDFNPNSFMAKLQEKRGESSKEGARLEEIRKRRQDREEEFDEEQLEKQLGEQFEEEEEEEQEEEDEEEGEEEQEEEDEEEGEEEEGEEEDDEDHDESPAATTEIKNIKDEIAAIKDRVAQEFRKQTSLIKGKAKESKEAAENARVYAETEIGKINANMKTKNENLSKRIKESFALRDKEIGQLKEENKKLSEEFAKLLKIVNEIKDGIQETKAKSSDTAMKPPPLPKAKQQKPSPAKTPKRPLDEDKVSPSPKKPKPSKPSPGKGKKAGEAAGKATGKTTKGESKSASQPPEEEEEEEDFIW